jgi:hypothetical protein
MRIPLRVARIDYTGFRVLRCVFAKEDVGETSSNWQIKVKVKPIQKGGFVGARGRSSLTWLGNECLGWRVARWRACRGQRTLGEMRCNCLLPFNSNRARRSFCLCWAKWGVNPCGTAKDARIIHCHGTNARQMIAHMVCG